MSRISGKYFFYAIHGHIYELDQQKNFTSFIVWCQNSHLHFDLCLHHLCSSWGQQVDKSTPQVLHCRGFQGDGELLVNRRRSLKNTTLDYVRLAANLYL